MDIRFFSKWYSKLTNNTKKYLRISKDIILLLLDLFSVGIGVYALFVGKNDYVQIIVAIIIINFIIVILYTIHQCVLHVYFNSKYKQLESENQYLNYINNANFFMEIYENMSADSFYAINATRIFLLRIRNHTNRYINKINEYLKANEKNIDWMKINEISRDYIEKMELSYIRFISNLVETLLYSMNSYLNAKNYNLEVTVTVKQFSKPLSLKKDKVSLSDISDIEVYTLFRNHRCYHKDVRKVKNATFDISKNTAFRECLSNKFYYFNNIHDTDRSFHNETVNFNKFYNCGVVAPICGDNNYYGFLACDVLNSSFKGDVFDTTSGLIVAQYGRLIAIYIEYMMGNWERLHLNQYYDDFLKMNYDRNFQKLKDK